jgi:hypothetical protein
MSKPPAMIHLARDLETGRLISADRAIQHPPKGRYQCLADNCGRFLTVGRSKFGRLHFKHFRDTDLPGCGGLWRRRKTLHDAAQDLLQTLFTEAIARRAPVPLFHFQTPAGVVTVLPFILANQVVREWTCPRSGRRADLAIVTEAGAPVLLIEVFHTHAVDGTKRLDLLPYWWIQVGARDVLNTPLQLQILDHGNLPYALDVLGHQGNLLLGY